MSKKKKKKGFHANQRRPTQPGVPGSGTGMVPGFLKKAAEVSSALVVQKQGSRELISRIVYEDDGSDATDDNEGVSTHDMVVGLQSDPVLREDAKQPGFDIREYLNRSEVAAMLRCTAETVTRLIKSGELRASRIRAKNSYLIRREDVVAYIESRQIGGKVIPIHARP